MSKYHVALSFAGEDREYVEKVASELRDQDVNVFYDKFEETDLWGKNLYTYLSDIYKNKANFTVIFISEHYINKLWTNHERESAQARAFAESKEYILPVKFDNSVEVPGILKTIGYLNLESLSPEELASKIVDKLEHAGISLTIGRKFSYSDEARADVDFHLPLGEEFSKIIQDLKSYKWPTQKAAINRFYDLNNSKLTPNQLFVMGRNIYQCATGSEKRAISIIKNIRKEMAVFTVEIAEHLINGMFYEVYFNKKGEFRGLKLKAFFLDELFEIQTVTKYSECISFIRKSLKPYSNNLAVLPCKKPEEFMIEISIKNQESTLITSIKNDNKELLVEYNEDDVAHDKFGNLIPRKRTIDGFIKEMSNCWHIPEKQMKVNCNIPIPKVTIFNLQNDKIIRPPFEY